MIQGHISSKWDNKESEFTLDILTALLSETQKCFFTLHRVSSKIVLIYER